LRDISLSYIWNIYGNPGIGRLDSLVKRTAEYFRAGKKRFCQYKACPGSQAIETGLKPLPKKMQDLLPHFRCS
jgi:hypothetical protein